MDHMITFMVYRVLCVQFASQSPSPSQESFSLKKKNPHPLELHKKKFIIRIMGKVQNPLASNIIGPHRDWKPLVCLQGHIFLLSLFLCTSLPFTSAIQLSLQGPWSVLFHNFGPHGSLYCPSANLNPCLLHISTSLLLHSSLTQKQ